MNAKKILAMALAAVLLVGASVMGTMAWLSAETKTVTNTFSTSNIEIDMKESPLNSTKNDGMTIVNTTPADDDGWDNRVAEVNDYKMVPNFDLDKDPAVQVKKGSEPCYVFVKIEEINNVASAATDTTAAVKFLTYQLGDNWKQLKDVEGVYVYTDNNNTAVVNAASGNIYLTDILKDNKVHVNEAITLPQMNSIGENNEPKLKLTAFATQAYSTNDTLFEIADAWKNVAPVEEPSAGDSAN